MKKLMNELKQLKKTEECLNMMEFEQKGDMVVLDLTYTIYDYYLLGEEVKKVLEPYFYEWYDSTIIHVYSKEIA